MAASLTMVDELDCWCLSDRGTYLNLRGGLDLHPIEFQESMLVNPYSALLLPGPQERQMDAVRFTNWLVSPKRFKSSNRMRSMVRCSSYRIPGSGGVTPHLSDPAPIEEPGFRATTQRPFDLPHDPDARTLLI